MTLCYRHLGVHVRWVYYYKSGPTTRVRGAALQCVRARMMLPAAEAVAVRAFATALTGRRHVQLTTAPRQDTRFSHSSGHGPVS